MVENNINILYKALSDLTTLKRMIASKNNLSANIDQRCIDFHDTYEMTFLTFEEIIKDVLWQIQPDKKP
jgi:aromatic ring hydroxylase